MADERKRERERERETGETGAMNINAAIDIKVILHSVRALAPWRTRRRTSLGLVVGSSSAGARAGAGHHADGDGQGKKNKQGDKTRSSLRRFIDDECPQPSPITGKRVEASIYAGDGGSSQAQVEESLLLLRGEDGGDSDGDSGSILLPGARRNVKVKRKDWESYTDMKEVRLLAALLLFCFSALLSFFSFTHSCFLFFAGGGARVREGPVNAKRLHECQSKGRINKQQ